MAVTYETVAAPVRGGRLHAGRWRPVGDRPGGDAAGRRAVLALHGVTASHLNWNAVAAAAPDVDLVAPDLRGRGLSADLPGPAGLHAHADDCAALLDALGLERVVVAGHSMGGLAAVVFADDYPELVERLVLIDGGLPLRAPPGLSVDQTIAATLGPAAARLAMVFPSRAAYVNYWRMHPAFAAGLNPAMVAFFAYDLKEVPGGFASRVRLDCVRDDVVSQLAPDVLPPALARLRVPARLLRAPRGFFDDPHPLYTPREVEHWQARLPLLRVTDVADVNHYTIMFEPRSVDLIVAALREQGRRPRPAGYHGS